MRIRWVGSTILWAATLVMTGCASGFDETHYFRSTTKDDRGIPVNYFRLRVSGGTMLSSSRYLSGYFDESALDTYFNEFTQPTNGQIFPASSTSPAGQPAKSDTNAGSSAPVTSKVEPLDGKLTGKKLLLVLSSNSDDIAAQIGNLAQSAAVSSDLEHLLSGGQLSSAQSAVAVQQKDKVIAGAVVQQATTTLNNLLGATPPSAEQSNAATLDIANRLGLYLGNKDQFKTLDEAAAWLRSKGANSLTKEAQ